MPSWFTNVYAAVLHLAALAALTVLTAMGKVDTTTGLSLIGGLVGYGAGVAVTPVLSSTPTPVAAPVATSVTTTPTAPASVVAVPGVVAS